MLPAKFTKSICKGSAGAGWGRAGAQEQAAGFAGPLGLLDGPWGPRQSSDRKQVTGGGVST